MDSHRNPVGMEIPLPRQPCGGVITQKLTLCQVVDFYIIWIFIIQTWFSSEKISPVAVDILRHHYTVKIQKITQSHTILSIYKINI